MHIEMHMDIGHCPMSYANLWHNWSKYRCYSSAASNVFIPHFRRGVFPHISESKCWKWEPISENVMGVAVLQLYPVQDNRTGPQVVELLTKRIMNQGTKDAQVQYAMFWNRCNTDRTIHRWLWSSPECYSGTQPTTQESVSLILINKACWRKCTCSGTFCTTPSAQQLFSQSLRLTGRRWLWPRTPSLTCWC